MLTRVCIAIPIGGEHPPDMAESTSLDSIFGMSQPTEDTQYSLTARTQATWIVESSGKHHGFLWPSQASLTGSYIPDFQVML